ncbi:hypothetical protein G6F66_014677 [Rhizopus arrhizus]|nr:hypothetical protein G6F66_014677 [Rhizopus arrhizus]
MAACARSGSIQWGLPYPEPGPFRPDYCLIPAFPHVLRYFPRLSAYAVPRRHRGRSHDRGAVGGPARHGLDGRLHHRLRDGAGRRGAARRVAGALPADLGRPPRISVDDGRRRHPDRADRTRHAAPAQCVPAGRRAGAGGVHRHRLPAA